MLQQELIITYSPAIAGCLAFIVFVFFWEINRVNKDEKRRREERTQRAYIQNLEWEEQLRRFSWLREAVRENHEMFPRDDDLRTFILSNEEIREYINSLQRHDNNPKEKVDWKKEGF